MRLLSATRDLDEVVVVILMADIAERTRAEKNFTVRQLDEAEASGSQRYGSVVMAQERRRLDLLLAIRRIAGEELPRLGDIQALRDKVRRVLSRHSSCRHAHARLKVSRVGVVVAVLLVHGVLLYNPSVVRHVVRVIVLSAVIYVAEAVVVNGRNGWRVVSGMRR